MKMWDGACPLPHLDLGSIVQSCGSPTMQAARKPIID
ncbi:hypothetical protein C4K03_3601 [Pseudomonas synxantha]|uniref:Uncharacterized protein n=1 Tax=Pseudomonas synxantha TaxID=47883 RepID=A0A3G7U8Q9_9PSED|nr:hypothetical protein C4K03_3601 [Pseudomonas synxantha]